MGFLCITASVMAIAFYYTPPNINFQLGEHHQNNKFILQNKTTILTVGIHTHTLILLLLLGLCLYFLNCLLIHGQIFKFHNTPDNNSHEKKRLPHYITTVNFPAFLAFQLIEDVL